MIGLLHPEKVAQLPLLKSWLRSGDTAWSVVRSRNTAADERAAPDELIEANVLQQLHHLRTRPSVAGRLAKATLALSGWVYHIGHGTVRIYNEEQRKFLPVTGDEQAASGGASQ
jgi:carbonic anhydrase